MAKSREARIEEYMEASRHLTALRIAEHDEPGGNPLRAVAITKARAALADALSVLRGADLAEARRRMAAPTGQEVQS